MQDDFLRLTDQINVRNNNVGLLALVSLFMNTRTLNICIVAQLSIFVVRKYFMQKHFRCYAQ